MRTTRRASFRLLEIATVFLFGVLAPALPGCNQSDQQIRQKSAQATRDARQGAKQLAANTKVAAGKAVDGVNAVAQGIKDGVNSNKPGDTGDRVDINSASTARLALLPGVSISKAQDIVKGRPYKDVHALVSRGLLTEGQYNRIADKITAK
jgi:DNA uptake protein ComE-like DNA-binding protein